MKLLQGLVILLLISFILFIIFQVERVDTKEGMIDQTEEVPRCQGSAFEDIPACYATVQSEDYLNYVSDFTNEDYVLKTKIVTPVCPNDPYDSKTSDITKPEERIITDSDDQNMIHSDRIITNPAETRNRETNRKDASNNPVLKLIQNNETDQPVPSNKETSSNDSSINIPSLPNLPVASTPSTPEKPKEPEPAKPSECKPAQDKLSSFPPCPACERCPEPVVDCKKVIHYKDKQYPAPIEETIFTRF